MPWLTREDEVLAAVELARHVSRTSAREGSVSVVDHAWLPQVALVPPNVDLALCMAEPAAHPDPATRALVVRGIGRLAALRLLAPRPSGVLVVAPAASFDRWQLRVGDHLEVKGLP